jgi:hypothetical protein
VFPIPPCDMRSDLLAREVARQIADRTLFAGERERTCRLVRDQRLAGVAVCAAAPLVTAALR